MTAHCEKSAGKIASIVGRFYAMDRDKRWERVKEAYDLLVEGKGKQAADMVQDVYKRQGGSTEPPKIAIIRPAAPNFASSPNPVSAMP